MLDLNGIKKIIPHREPFLLVDRILEMDDKHAVGIKQIRADEAYFKGHFPGNPVMPGVLQLEAIAQVSGILILSRKDHLGKTGYFSTINNVKFRGIVRPGDELRIEAEHVKEKKRFFISKGICKVNGEVVAEAEMMLFLADHENS
jgi:beta-hydroxyacyl-ACP dehydratase FabZ